MDAHDQAGEVSTYYDRNTRRFLTFGVGGRAQAIRRAVWAPGVESREEALQYANGRILGELRQLGAETVVDLGCGVGGSIRYLGERHPASYEGVTLSPVQAEMAKSVTSGLRSRIHLRSFTDAAFWNDVPDPIDAAFSIEASVHVRDLTPALREAAGKIRHGGRLVVVDDFLREAPPGSAREERWIREFKEGWHAPGLRRVSQLQKAAEDHGFALLENDDLTPYLELDRPRDLAARLFVSLLRWWPWKGAWFSNLYGGNALQLSLKARLFNYRYLVFERDPPKTA